MKVNKENLQRAIDYLKNDVLANNKQFNMNWFRRDNELNKECNSTGCVIGHTVALDWENVTENFLSPSPLSPSPILFSEWSQEFYFNNWNKQDTDFFYLWDFLFAARWSANSNDMNTLEKTIERLEWFMGLSNIRIREKIITPMEDFGVSYYITNFKFKS